jgi:hypothetical protein
VETGGRCVRGRDATALFDGAPCRHLGQVQLAGSGGRTQVPALLGDHLGRGSRHAPQAIAFITHWGISG